MQGAGYWVFAPVRLAGGSLVIVNRGYVPLDRKDPASRAQGEPHGSVDIVGIVRWPETRGMFTPADDVGGQCLVSARHRGDRRAKKWAAAAPFYIDEESPGRPAACRSPASCR